MRLLPVALLLLCVSAPVPVLADALAPSGPRGTHPSGPDVAPRRTGRVPARIAVAPPGSASAPTHVVITIPWEVLRDVMATPRAGAPLAPFDDDGSNDRSERLRHLLAAGLLTLAVLSLPLLIGMRRRGRAAALVVVAVLTGVALVRADVVAPRPSTERTPPTPAPAQPGGPQTVEVIIISGKGPVQVQLSYPPRP